MRRDNGPSIIKWQIQTFMIINIIGLIRWILSMTEDDTFNALKKTPFKILEELMLDKVFEDLEKISIDSAMSDFILSHGWNEAEFWHEYYSLDNMMK